jgi:hypothetical protein
VQKFKGMISKDKREHLERFGRDVVDKPVYAAYRIVANEESDF